MRLGVLLMAVLGALPLGGCLRSVAIPQQEAALKDACHGKDRPMAGVGGFSVYRCGEGDKAKYAVYENGALVRELSQIDASQLSAGFVCVGRGLKMKTPEYQACAQAISERALIATSSLRETENAEAEAKQARTVAAIGAGLAAGAAAASAAQPAYQPAPAVAPMQMPVTCNSQRLGNFVNTRCF